MTIVKCDMCGEETALQGMGYASPARNYKNACAKCITKMIDEDRAVLQRDGTKWADGAEERIKPMIAKMFEILHGGRLHDNDTALWFCLATTYRAALKQGVSPKEVVIDLILPGMLALIDTVGEFDQSLAAKMTKLKEELK